MTETQALANAIVMLGSQMNMAISITTNPDLTYNIVAITNTGARFIIATVETIQDMINTMSSITTAMQIKRNFAA
jgi:hypothetical protein